MGSRDIVQKYSNIYPMGGQICDYTQMTDDPMTEDVERLLGDGYRDLPSDVQRERVKDAVDYGRFVPSTTPETADTSLYNPAVDGYRDAGLTWGETGWEPIDETAPLQTYPEYVPTDHAIQTLVDLGPLVEVGAGDGYWAHVVNENGGDCIPTDICPLDHDAETFPSTVQSASDDWEPTVWADVQAVDGVEAVRAYPDRAVMMCHPSGADRWSERVLDAVSDQPFVFIGEWFPGTDATPWFFKRLAENWGLVDDFPVYGWESSAEHGYVFERPSDEA